MNHNKYPNIPASHIFGIKCCLARDCRIKAVHDDISPKVNDPVPGVLTPWVVGSDEGARPQETEQNQHEYQLE